MIEAAEGEWRNLFVSRHRLRSGAERDVEVHSSPIALDGGRALLSIGHDITDRVRTERQLVESEADYRRALEQAPDAIVVSDRQGSILEVNARAEELTVALANSEMIASDLPPGREDIKSELGELRPAAVRR
jgi:PAS domain-containing protein